jgi:hypothetical protein
MTEIEIGHQSPAQDNELKHQNEQHKLENEGDEKRQ